MNNTCKFVNQLHFPFILPELPYASNALEPYMSANTFSYHHQKHHNAYVTNLNKLLENSELKSKSLEEIILASHNQADKAGIFNNAAQVWNHSFFWHCLKENGGGAASGIIADKIIEDFGSFDKFIEDFKNAATTQFGSGWAWLVLNESNKLEIIKTSNADLPLTHNKKALLTIDVWEHAYYLDFQNLRLKYVETFLSNLVNWDFVNLMLEN